MLLAIPSTAEAAAARDLLGVYQGWAAFRDVGTGAGAVAGPKRCYAIAAPDDVAGRAVRKPFVAVGIWPARGVTGQLHVRLSRDRSQNAAVTMTLGGRSFTLTGGRSDVYAASRRMDATIIAALRGASSLSIESVGDNGRPLVDAYSLRGAPSAIDAARIGCLPPRR